MTDLHPSDIFIEGYTARATGGITYKATHLRTRACIHRTAPPAIHSPERFQENRADLLVGLEQEISKCLKAGGGMSWPFASLAPGKYGALLVDPPWKFRFWSDKGRGNRAAEKHYDTIASDDLADLPIGDLALSDCVLFLWIGWPYLPQAMALIEAWGFTYKTCAFDWVKANVQQIDFFRDDADVQVGLGWWTRANTEPCLLATRGKPKRLNADVRQGIIAPRREHSRKPDGIHERIERLVAGPYVELFARETRKNWDSWGHEVGKFDAPARDPDDIPLHLIRDPALRQSERERRAVA